MVLEPRSQRLEDLEPRFGPVQEPEQRIAGLLDDEPV
jgi:hypothetical protein